MAGGPAVMAQNITRSGPDASHDPIVNSGTLDFVLVKDGASINAGADGAAIRNTTTGVVGNPFSFPIPTPPQKVGGVTVDGSTINGAIVNQGSIDSYFGIGGLAITSGTITGGVSNSGTISGQGLVGAE